MPALRRFARAIPVALASLPLCPPTLAQVPSARMEPVFVTATRTPEPLSSLVADVTTIDQEEIARSGVQSLSELLQRQPGIEVTRNGGPGATSALFLRGTNRGQTLVLIDGVRVASSTVGSASLEAIPLADIERIEILRGPASSLYGSDAIGGVIQIFTRRGGERLASDASAGYGTHDTSTIAGGLSGTRGPVRFAIHADAQRSGGFNAIVDPANFSYNPDRDGYKSAGGTASLGFEWLPGQAISLDYLRNRLDNQFDAGQGFDDRTITVVEARQVASRNRIAAWWTSTLSAAEGIDDSLSKTGFGDARFRTDQRLYTWQNMFGLPAGSLTAGYERREERVDAEGFAVTARDTDALFAIYQLQSGPHAIQASVRHDHSTQFGGRTTGSAAYGYRLSPSWRLTVAAGTAFKAPSFNDLYYPGFSNPDLKPETSRSIEAGVHGSGTIGSGTWRLDATAWRNRVESLIVFGCDANFVCRPDNVDRATLQGVTLAAEAGWRATIVKASVDLQSPEDDRTGHLLPRRARTHGAVTLLHDLGPARLGVEWIASSRRYDDAANLVALGGYGIVNLTLEWPLQHGVALFARADNVLDKDYELASGYATGGTLALVGLRWQR